jgi:hypothetical protein
MPGENILVIAVDGLRAAALGAYGNTKYRTTALDQLAAESLLFDWWFADAADLTPVYRSYWQTEFPLPRSFAQHGYSTTLLTDLSAILEFEGAREFDACIQLPEPKVAKAGDVSETALAQLFAATCEHLESPAPSGPRFVWVHSRGMYGPWDAPVELQDPLLEREEGDPPPADSADPPELVLDGLRDPDAAFRWGCAYAAQVMVLGSCIEALRQSLDEVSAREPWSLVLCGVRGFPLGEHGRVGTIDGRLFAEQLHVPMLWRSADGSERLERSSQLASHADLAPMLLSRLRGTFRAPTRDAVIARGPGGNCAIRTPDWTLRCEPQDVVAELSADPSPVRCELFVRPDDRWEANDVAALCPDVVQELLARLGQDSSAVASPGCPP